MLPASCALLEWRSPLEGQVPLFPYRGHHFASCLLTSAKNKRTPEETRDIVCS
ncbi:unnamed protein product [Ixodes persulcatus]